MRILNTLRNIGNFIRGWRIRSRHVKRDKGSMMKRLSLMAKCTNFNPIFPKAKEPSSGPKQNPPSKSKSKVGA